MTLERRKAAGEAWGTVLIGGAGDPDSKTVTVTTDPDTFDGAAIFDLGVPGVGALRTTLSAVDGDGETFGDGPGEIAALLHMEVSADGVNWTSGDELAVDFSGTDNNGNLSTIGQFSETMTATLRQVRSSVAIYDDAGNPYAGPNHPTATVDVSCSVFTLGSQLT